MNKDNSNECLENFTEIIEICPHCEIELEAKMFDVDGKNLSEHNVCPRCNYGTPSLL